MPIKLFLIDDHALFREGLATVLEAKGGFQVLGKADSVNSALEALAGIVPDLILLDVDLGNGRALEFLRRAHAQQIADVHVCPWHVFLAAVGGDAARGLWRQTQQRLDGSRQLRMLGWLAGGLPEAGDNMADGFLQVNR